MTDLPFVSALVQADLPVWEQCLQAEFLQKMENGTLSEDCFKSYLVEDSLYLREYAKIFAWGMTKATTMAAMRTYYSLLSFVQENEDLTRLRYLEQYGLREADIQSLPLRPESRAYLDCMIDAARTGEGEAECLMACLPCMLSYGWLFQKLLQRSPAVKDTYYGALVLDYAGFSEGVQFPGGTAEKQTLTLGSGMFIPGFEEQLVGANIGDDVTVTVTFPTEYHAPELAGKNAEFRCHVHEIRTHDSYQLDDTFAKEIGQCENMEQMRENMGKALQDYYNQRAEQELRWQLMHQAAATVEEQPIDEELDRMVEAQMETLTAQLAQKGLTLEAYCQFTGSDEKKLREDMRPDALEAFRTQKAVEKIAQLENLTVTDEEMDAAIQRICADNHMSAEDLKPYFDNGFLTVVRQQMLRDKATEVVRRSARITQ